MTACYWFFGFWLVLAIGGSAIAMCLASIISFKYLVSVVTDLGLDARLFAAVVEKVVSVIAFAVFLKALAAK